MLVVANVTATSPELLERADRAGPGSEASTFTLIVPATPIANGRAAARASLGQALEKPPSRRAARSTGGRERRPDPRRVSDEWDPRRYDEIVVSTLPMRISKWLHAGLPERIERMTGARVTHVVSQPPKPEIEATPAPVHEKHGVMTPLSVLTWGTQRQP